MSIFLFLYFALKYEFLQFRMDDLLLTTLTSLGFDKAGEYQPDIDVVNSVRVLIKYLLHDTKNCDVRLQIGSSNIWAKAKLEKKLVLVVIFKKNLKKNQRIFQLL